MKANIVSTPKRSIIIKNKNDHKFEKGIKFKAIGKTTKQSSAPPNYISLISKFKFFAKYPT